MKNLRSVFTLPEPEFTFAGFAWPRYVAMLPRGALRDRLARRKQAFGCGPYYHAPRPLARPAGGEEIARSFYLDSDFMPGLRWQYCDDIAQSIRHSGWFTDNDGMGETIRGIVLRLPHNRGFLAGWTMGESMASMVDYGYIFDADDEIGAALCADSMAEYVAERERDYQAELDADDEGEEA